MEDLDYIKQLERRNRVMDRWKGSPLIMALYLDRRFRWAAILLLGFFFGMALSIPKIWRVSPDDFQPTVRISLLDRAQAWALARSARRNEAEERIDEAGAAWRAAIANHPTCVRYLQGCLEHEIRHGDRKSHDYADANVRWMLRLSRTNAMDLEVAIRFYQRWDEHEVIHSLLEARPVEELNAGQRAAYLISEFETERMDAFDRDLPLISQASELDPERAERLALYVAAYRAGWTHGDEAARARAGLERQADGLKAGVLVNRLLMRVARQTLSREDCRRALEALQQRGGDRLADHQAYWQMLSDLGAKDDLLALVRASSRPPATVPEALEMARWLESMELPEEAVDCLAQSREQFGELPSLWMAAAEILARCERWDDLRDLAQKTRPASRQSQAMVGYGHYLQGWANLRQDHAGAARESFQTLARLRISPPSLAVLMALRILELDFPAEAEEILAAVEADLSASDAYWRLRLKAAHQLNDAERMMHCARGAYFANPDDAINVNNYAGMLLMQRLHPDEALPLTLKVLAVQPHSAPARINHALALHLNARTGEAVELLSRLNIENLLPNERAALHLLELEIQVGREEWKPASASDQAIREEFLTPGQRKLRADLRLRIPETMR